MSINQRRPGLLNPIQFFNQARQPGGLLAPAENLQAALGDFRVPLGINIAQGVPLGQAIFNAYDTSNTIQTLQARRKVQDEIDSGTALEDIGRGTILQAYPEIASSLVQDAFQPKETNYDNTTIRRQDGSLVAGRENTETGALEILTEEGYVPGQPTDLKTTTSIVAPDAEGLGGDDKSTRTFQEDMLGFQTTDTVLNQLDTLLEDPNTLTASVPQGLVNTINNVRANITQTVEVFADSDKTKKISESELLKQNEDLFKNAGASTGAFRSLLITAAFSIARSNNPDGRISDADFRTALQSLTAGGADKDVIQNVLRTQQTLNKTNAQNYFDSAKRFQIDIPENVTFETYFPTITNQQQNPQMQNNTMGNPIYDINGNLIQ